VSVSQRRNDSLSMISVHPSRAGHSSPQGPSIDALCGVVIWGGLKEHTGPCRVSAGPMRLVSSADLHDVRDFFGHANITTTPRYLRSTPVRLAQALERMEASAETVANSDDQLHFAEVRGRSHVRDDQRSVAVRTSQR